jgi:ferredoxin
MTYIIADPCVGTCDTACVEVCPVDCIHGPEDKEGAGAEAKEPGFDPTGKQLYIDPEAIFEEDAVPEEWKSFIKINYDWFDREFDG